MLKANGPKKWIFEEYCNLSEMQFRFKDKDTPLNLGILICYCVFVFTYIYFTIITTVSGVVHSMQVYPLEEVLTAPYIITDWRPDLIEDLQTELSPHTCRIIVVGQKLEPIANSIEKWYGTKYHWEKLDKNTLEVNSLNHHNCLLLTIGNIYTGVGKLWIQFKAVVSKCKSIHTN